MDKLDKLRVSFIAFSIAVMETGNKERSAAKWCCCLGETHHEKCARIRAFLLEAENEARHG